jgi:hypothetical protein
MKRLMVAVLGVGLVLAMTAVATASVDSFVAASNQFGYQGTVSNVTNPGNGPWAFPTPRDASVYFTKNVPGWGSYNGYNQILSNWFDHPTSNQNPGFFQLGDPNQATVTSATGGWTQNGSLWDFTMTVTGQNATYANSTARLWQPDADMAWGGTFTNYTYTLTATGMQTEVDGDGWRYNYVGNVEQAPTGITGSFDATFVSTQEVYGGPSDLTGRDTYLVHLDFNETFWDDTGYTAATYSVFGAPVPEPATIIVWSLLGLTAAGFVAS